MKKKYTKIILCLLFSLFWINSNSQVVSGLISAGNLLNGPAYWITAGAPSLTGNPIFVDRVINVVEDLNLKNDNSEDCSYKLNEHITKNKLPNPNQIFMYYFPKGTYRFGSTISLPANVILKGDGADGPQTQFNYYGVSAFISIVNGLGVGIEDISITRRYDTYTGTDNDGYTIFINNSLDCWVRGVSIAQSWKSSVNIVGGSHHITISGCDISNPRVYGDNGQGYGVVLENATDCLIEDNVFSLNRHSIVFQGFSYHNIAGYNFSNGARGTFFEELGPIVPGFTTPADIEFHGMVNSTAGPTENLIEGNYVDAIRFSSVHHGNGPHNTLMRNYATSGIYMGLFDHYHDCSGFIDCLACTGGHWYSVSDYQKMQNVVLTLASSSTVWIPSNCFTADPTDGSSNTYSLISYFGEINNWETSTLFGSISSDYDLWASYYKTHRPDFMINGRWPYLPSDNIPATVRVNNYFAALASNIPVPNVTVPVGWKGYFCAPFSARNFILADNQHIDFDKTYRAYNTIEAGPFTVESRGSVKMIATKSIHINSGFQVKAGAYFHAYFGNCTTPSMKKSESQEDDPQPYPPIASSILPIIISKNNALSTPEKINEPTTNSNNNATIVVFPNPNNGEFTLTQSTAGFILDYIITDLQGRAINSFSNAFDASKQVQIKTENMATGIYVINGKTSDGKSFHKKIIIQK